MIPIEEQTAETILSSETMTELFDMEDKVERQELIGKLGIRAKELKCKTDFNNQVKFYQQLERNFEREQREAEKEQKEAEKAEKKAEMSSLDNWTNFTDCPYGRMMCGSWIATDDKIYQQNPYGYTDRLACYHPIMPIERLKNMETSEEKIRIAYKRNNKWSTITTDKTTITSASKIVGLSSVGVSVNSETAKALVLYLSDVENLNDESIPIKYSSSKLGWKENGFLPYDLDVEFDGDARFNQIFNSIKEPHGDRDVWYEHMKELRQTSKIEIKMMLAASFSSVLIQPIGALPYFVDLWGETEGGKTVTLMVAASVWGNPDESQFIGDFKTTDVALEAKADMLNHLPVILDDTSKTSKRIRENFEGVVYDLCSGKGKSRSNKELGLNRENHWRNCFLTSGERPLDSYVDQGGAMNRIIEVECHNPVYKDPQETVDIVKNNYGYAGRDFVQAVKEVGTDKIKEMQRKFQNQLMDDEKMQKQTISMSIILTADKIATDYLFKDGKYISVESAKRLLIDRAEVSDGERAYEYIREKVLMNSGKFDGADYGEQWGTMDGDYALFYASAFNDILKAGGFSKKAFLSWAEEHGVLMVKYVNGAKDKTPPKSIHGHTTRFYWIRIEGDDDQMFE